VALAASAQERERMRRIGVLMTIAADGPEAPARLTALAQGLQQLGWTVGRNVRIDHRSAPSTHHRRLSRRRPQRPRALDASRAPGLTTITDRTCNDG